mgnify:CR=1 FL=1
MNRILNFDNFFMSSYNLWAASTQAGLWYPLIEPQTSRESNPHTYFLTVSDTEALLRYE